MPVLVTQGNLADPQVIALLQQHVTRARRRGVATALMQHLLAAGRRSGLTRLSLETGSWDYFEPARAFYRRHGFRDCAPFAHYRVDPNSVFMTREL